ncbi:MAG: endolytic transglycosylase MltG [Sphaerochaetaceae bacterium]|nr:endolytic transglycosylase MltG [Sphaerochaetaceae bacterium]
MSTDRPHSKNIAKDISRKKHDAVTGRNGRQLSLPFDELEVPTLESAKRKLEASKAERRKAIPGQSHGAKAVFGAADKALSETAATKITPYTSQRPNQGASQKTSALPRTARIPEKVSGGGARLRVPKKPSSQENTFRADPETSSVSKEPVIMPPSEISDRKQAASGPAVAKPVPSKSGAAKNSVKASREFSTDVDVYEESADGVDFRSRASRSASIARESRSGGQNSRLSPEQESRLAREAMLGTVKKQIASSRKKDIEPDLALHAGPGPTMENRKKTSSSVQSRRGTVKNSVTPGSGGRTDGKTGGKTGIRRIGGEGFTTGGGGGVAASRSHVNGIEMMVLVLVILAVVLMITLVVAFVRTGRTAEKRVPVVAENVVPLVGTGNGVSTGLMSEAPAAGGGTGQVTADNTLLVEIRAGMTARQVCQTLADHGVVSDSQALLDYLVSENLAGSIQQGSFLLKTGMDVAGCASAITNKPSSVVDVTVFPGYTIADIDRLLASRGYAEAGEFIGAADALAKGYGLSFAEGWFLAGTYQVPRTNGAQTLAMAMYQAMLDALRPLFGNIAVLDRSVDDVLIVASMIQRETNAASEMPLIAGIIYKRLDEGIALGIDATTRYETGNWTDPINPIDLETLTPYNTRRKKGLPPSGIGCVGLDALNAAVYPSTSDWYYYLHGTDGMIHFARTYEEHTQNISIWR